MGRLPGHRTPRLHEALVRLSPYIPAVAHATAALAWCTGATVPPDTARRRTEAAGALLVAHETRAVARIFQEQPDPPAGSATLVRRVDGAMVPVVGGPWKAVRTLAVGEGLPPQAGPDGPIIRTTNLSSCARRTDSTIFADRALPELHRRGSARVGRVGAVVDGAAGCPSFLDYPAPAAVRLLDFPHRAE